MELNATIIGQAITFILLVLFTMKFVWPPLNGMLEERAKRIADGLAAAEKGKRELVQIENRVNEELRHAQTRALEIIANSERRATTIIAQAKEQAALESNRIIADAKIQIDQQLVKAKEQLRQRVAILAVMGAKQILKAEINEERHSALLTNIKAQL